MYKLGMIFDYDDSGSWPAWLLVKPESGQFDWSCDTLYIPLNAPYERLYREDICEEDIGITIMQTDLVVSIERPHHFGIYLPRVKSRINKLRGEQYVPQFYLSDIRHFVIPVSDIEPIMQINFGSIVDF